MVELKKPAIEYFPSYMDFIEEMKGLGEKIWEGQLPKSGENPENFVERLIRSEVEAEPGLATETTYWAVVDSRVVGRIALRHHLTEKLAEFGGHIGYEVRPSFRRQGIAKEMLKAVLENPKAREIGHLLLTCSPENVASNKTIQANGGVLTKTAFAESIQRNTNYYWIRLKSNS